jgi:uncharacterized protein (TIGR02301 family)
MTKLWAILIVGLLTLNTGSALAQDKPAADGKAVEKPALPQLIAPYDKKLMRLAEVLGSIHFLRELCKADEGQLWRDKMAALIDAEKPRPLRKRRLIARFNRGYGAFSRTYRSCTPVALLAIKRYMKEGVRLTSQIASRYGR